MGRFVKFPRVINAGLATAGGALVGLKVCPAIARLDQAVYELKFQLAGAVVGYSCFVVITHLSKRLRLNASAANPLGPEERSRNGH